ncbi:hypothetical protein AMTR_s00075p00026030 [Amborella trichopoda]|uniref:Uncharacterized protein n=1 Tax=Amborella trichopoda TaxID=13333 RepID=W1P3V6_AMBTC|nr:hypothetical protein AMTR_s00075p00026030 [Amborella trichopoda]
MTLLQKVALRLPGAATRITTNCLPPPANSTRSLSEPSVNERSLGPSKAAEKQEKVEYEYKNIDDLEFMDGTFIPSKHILKNMEMGLSIDKNMARDSHPFHMNSKLNMSTRILTKTLEAYQTVKI